MRNIDSTYALSSLTRGRLYDEARFASLPPSQIVPRLADEGVYLASESISAILKNRIPEEVVFSIIINPAFQWLSSFELIDEYKKVLVRPKFKLPDTIVQNWFSIF